MFRALRSRRAYTLLVWLLLPYALFHLLWRARRQPAYLEHLGERFGFYKIAPRKPLIWVHAVSVGETRAAVPLIRRLTERYPDHQILLTHMTPTGRETGEQLFGEQVQRAYLPYDFPFAVNRFLAHFRPAIGILMETEIWFNLINACGRKGIPLCLVNARMSAKSAARYARFALLARQSLRKLAAVAAQTEADARRLAALGAERIQVTGNLKFDVAPAESALALGETLRRRFGLDRPVFLAASTREGEEELLLNALDQASTSGFLAVIVPRHPQRFNEVAAMLESRGIPFQRRSADTDIAPGTRVVLGDSMGEMFAYYAACDLAFIGGSLLPHGGQNLIEACAVGKPVLIGPHTFNFEEASQLAVDAGAAIRVADARQLIREVNLLLANEAKRKTMAEAGTQFAKSHQGATDKVLKLIEPLVDRVRGEG